MPSKTDKCWEKPKVYCTNIKHVFTYTLYAQRAQGGHAVEKGQVLGDAQQSTYIAHTFNMYSRIHYMRSVRKGDMLSKKDKGWEKPKERNRHVICIEDPFDVDVDLGRYVDELTIKDIQQVCCSVLQCGAACCSVLQRC